MEYTRDYFIHYFQSDRNRNVSIVSLIRILEDMAILQSEDVGYGLDFYEREKVGWMLSRWDITVNRLPRFREQIRVVTRPQAMNKFYANRFYWVYDQENNLLIEAATLWIFFNTEKRRPQAVSREIIDAYAGSDRNSYPFSKLTEIEETEEPEFFKEYAVNSDTIDFNNHVNNSQYFFWAIDSIPPDKLAGFDISEIKVNYLKETNENDRILSQSSVTQTPGGLISNHSLRSGDKEVCRLKISWKKNT